jgi:radical SAM protein with 4Fe4S-binding SPASM domain
MTPGPIFAAAPRLIYWEVTRACDLACRHCRAEAAPTPDPDELGPAEGRRLVRRLAAFGHPTPHLILTGGDPLKRPDLFGLIAAARDAGLGVSVAPSATPRLTAAVITQLREAGVEAISLSLDGADPARHDALRGVRGCFDRTLQAARAARAAGLPFQINSLVSRQTLDDLPAVYELARRCGAARWSLFFLVAVGRGTVLDPISPVECEQLLVTLAGLAARPGPPVVTTTEAPHFRRVVFQRGGGVPRAHGLGIRDGNGVMFITHAGEVYPSGFLAMSVGSVREADPVALYREAPLFQTLRRPDLFRGRCGRCEFRGVCGGSRARAFAATGSPLAEDPLCAYEPGRGARAS